MLMYLHVSDCELVVSATFFDVIEFDLKIDAF
jgi:hypothetical protein